MNAGVERLILNKIPICQLRSGPPGHQSDGSGKKAPALQRRKKRNSNVCNARQRRAHSPLDRSSSILHPTNLKAIINKKSTNSNNSIKMHGANNVVKFRSKVTTPTPHEQNERQTHKIKTANKSFKKW
jgi:hypothetical protein